MEVNWEDGGSISQSVWSIKLVRRLPAHFHHRFRSPMEFRRERECEAVARAPSSPLTPRIGIASDLLLVLTIESFVTYIPTMTGAAGQRGSERRLGP